LLTADLARVRRYGGELRLAELNPAAVARAEQLAAQFLEVTRAHLGRTRAELGQVCSGVPTTPSERKIAAGLLKLIEDRCGFEGSETLDARLLRAELFMAASAALRALGEGECFDRNRFVREQAELRAVEPDALERAVYSDLQGEQLLQQFEDISPAKLVQAYQSAQAQAVLLRAVKVTAEVSETDAYLYRALFRKLKFLRLLHTLAPLEQGGYKIDIDGPYSLFSSVTKYGLQLALALPALQACGKWKIEARVCWGKERQPYLFRLRGATHDESTLRQTALPDEVRDLLQRFGELDTAWIAEPSNDILELAGAGLCVPDLRFTNRLTGEIVHLEVMGYWSRDALWKRVELASAGLPYRVIFAASSRLRVSESVLDENSPSQLYIYRGAISSREIARRLEGI
jgi:uncharacterized protein